MAGSYLYGTSGINTNVPTRTTNTSALAMATSGTYYYKVWDGDIANATAADTTVSGFTTGTGTVGISSLAAYAASIVISHDAQISHTTDDSQLDLSIAESFGGVAITETTPGSSTIHHAVSFDGRLTFKIWKSSAWYDIVQLSGATWQYKNAVPAWANASTNTLLGALTQAFAVAGNKILGSVYEALTAANWVDTGGLDLDVNHTLDFAQLFTPDGTNNPRLTGYQITYSDSGTVRIEARQAGEWNTLSVTDNTDAGGVSLAISGTMTFADTTLDYDTIDNCPGYWLRLWTNGTSSGTAISQIKYSGPGQDLCNIGDGQPDTVAGAFIYDSTTEKITDIGYIISDTIETDLSSVTIPLNTSRYLYFDYLTRFNAIEITPLTGYENSATVTSFVEVWTGETWETVTSSDGTSVSGKTFSKKGIITWTAPDTWKKCIPFTADYDRGYWARIRVSGTLTATTAIVEAKVYPVPDAIAKHRFADVVKNRLALVGRPDKLDQVDISRAGEPWGFCGPDSASGRAMDRLGGEGAIQCVFGGWDGLFMGQPETWHQLTGTAPSNFRIETIEASRHVPINSRCIVKAPMPGGDDGSKNAVIFLNRYGCFAAMGIQADGSFASGRVLCLSSNVDWWTPDLAARTSASPDKIDMDYIHQACMEYDPINNCVVCSVPMLIGAASSQTTNNRLLLFDIGLQAWLPAQDIEASALCLAYEYNANAPGHLGALELLAGDYSGRIIRLNNGEDDDGSDITGFIETGNLDFGQPNFQKRLRWMRVFGVTTGATVTLSIYLDGATTPVDTWSFTNLTSPASSSFAIEPVSANLLANFFRFKIEWTGQTHIYGIPLKWRPERDIEGTGVV